MKTSDILQEMQRIRASLMFPFPIPEWQCDLDRGGAIIIPSGHWRSITGLPDSQKSGVMLPWGYGCIRGGAGDGLVLVPAPSFPMTPYPSRIPRFWPGGGHD
jgi:hypothetical protein